LAGDCDQQYHGRLTPLMRTARVELVWFGPNPPSDFFARVGDREFQICRATVDVDNRVARVAMFWPADGEATSTDLVGLTDSIQREHPATVLAIVRASAEGSVTVETPRGDGWHLFAIAAVAAVTRVSWAWDDSPTIAVTVNDQRITIDPHYTGEVWEAVEIIDRAV
jgi:hypothetical protein